MSPRGTRRKYTPLTDYLRRLACDEITLTLAEVERIIGAPLPPTARQPPFWANSLEGQFHVRPWVRAGWRMRRNDLRSVPPTVTFVRMPPTDAEE